MPRFLLAHGNSTFKDGSFNFSLDRRFRNATHLRVKKASYVADSGLTVVPPVVYLRSKALHRLASNKHTLELKNTGHENDVDVLAVLEETHTTGRYRLNTFERFIRLDYSHLREIDFYFTDSAGTNLSTSTSTFNQVSDDFDTPTDQEKTGHIFRSYDTGGSGNNYGDNETLNRIYISSAGVNWKIKVLAFTTEAS